MNLTNFPTFMHFLEYALYTISTIFLSLNFHLPLKNIVLEYIFFGSVNMFSNSLLNSFTLIMISHIVWCLLKFVY